MFFGDSITDGACSTVDTNNRWPDHIAERLQAEGHPDVAVVNEAYSGDRVLTNGMGTNALSRFDMSVLSHPRVSTVVMMMGINDIGWPGKDAITPSDPEPTAEDVIAGYKQIIQRAHDHGIRFVGVTLTPFIDTFKGLPTSGYYTPEKEKIREAVNDWIRANKTAEGTHRLRQTARRPQQSKAHQPSLRLRRPPAPERRRVSGDGQGRGLERARPYAIAISNAPQDASLSLAIKSRTSNDLPRRLLIWGRPCAPTNFTPLRMNVVPNCRRGSAKPDHTE